ncbi:cytochrome C biogenesis protein [Aliarcobacter skirrowii]|uniref:Cytochrome C biogenesis protein n=3 Tax=Aliarcobacter skirrowii TaxID=28200 RepID=A0A2U2C2U3_9BACT|nr:cytochrome c biogenesis protein CcsA [Aliarcobacter skirrowii]PWE22794.1 cytochrome C biogenesis protein [Aliarcobacter skirrowii]PWE23330.1 cytochrome C biogenesis protein [Aliarcobacter skirrowii]RJO56557.1 cytochrome C biogenesis protein [Aliarcobacter skirrowii]RJO58511.1 cytochrome C biogenesis protein [Aliarcobacter skirrowii]
MTKFLKNIFSMQVMLIFLIFMALACAVATFVENDFGVLGAKSFVYGQNWFEFIMLFLTLGVAFHIIFFKMYKKDKFFILIIHLSIIFIFIGSAMTRYLGYEAVMTIPEGSIENKVYSTNEYIQIRISDEKEQKYYEKEVMMTPLNQTKFEYNTKIDDKVVSIKYKDFIQNAIERLAPSSNGKVVMDILLSEVMGAKNIILEDKSKIDTNFVTFTLNNNLENQTKATVNFETINNEFYLTSNLKVSMYTNDLQHQTTINANEKIKIQKDIIYKIGQTQFKVFDALLNGELKVINNNEMFKIDEKISAVLVDLKYDGKVSTIPLYKKDGSSIGVPQILDINGKKIEILWGAKEITLPFSILLNDFVLERYPGSNAPSTYSSFVKVYDTKTKESFEYTIFMNNVLDYKGYRFFQSSYEMNESATILSVNKDPGKIPTYIGYFLLFLGLILILFVKNSRFSKLLNKKYSIEDIKQSYYLRNSQIAIFMLFVIFFPKESFSNDFEKIYNIDKIHSQKFGSILVQDYQGRIKPINSLAIEILNKTTKKSQINNLDANQFFLSMMMYPEIWRKIPIFKVKDNKIKELLNILKEDSYFAFDDVYDKYGGYLLSNELEISNKKSSSNRTKYDKELIKIDEALNISYSLFNGDFFKVFPLKHSPNNKWLSILEANSYENEQSLEIKNLIKNYYFSLLENSWDKADTYLDEIKQYQYNLASHIFPSETKIKAELLLNDFDIFERLMPFYLILGLLLLIIVFINILNPNLNISKITKLTLYLLIFAFIFQTFGLILRWYVAGHAPWTNGYESMIYISWAIVLSGILFSKQSHLALSCTAILSGITLFVAHLSWLEPQITTLAPVLKSYWLTIHVSVITASYGFLALSALLGFFCLILYILINPKNENERFFRILLSIKESSRINEISIFIGVILLVIGNFLGGIWANESWGRYWAWDPKETWTLISIIIYITIIHLKYVKGMINDYTLNLLSVVSYSSIIMTYFGVNYFLSGKHSYAAGEPIIIPNFVYVMIAVVFVVIVLSFKNRKVI